MTLTSKYGKSYTIKIMGRSGNVYYCITDWHIDSATNRLEFIEGGKTIVTTHTYVITED